MYDITTGEVNKPLRVTLQSVDTSQNPFVIIPINLTNATLVQLIFCFGDLFQPIGASQTRNMTIIDALNGIVQYIFVGTDLAQPPGANFTGIISYVVKITFNDGTILESGDIGRLTVKEGF